MTLNRVVFLAGAVVLAAVLAVVGVLLTGRPFEPTEAQKAAFVESQAKANCVVQGTVFPSREKLEAAYQAAALSTGLDTATVKKLQDYENRNQDLRVAISDRVQALCT